MDLVYIRLDDGVRTAVFSPEGQLLDVIGGNESLNVFEEQEARLKLSQVLAGHRDAQEWTKAVSKQDDPDFPLIAAKIRDEELDEDFAELNRNFYAFNERFDREKAAIGNPREQVMEQRAEQLRQKRIAEIHAKIKERAKKGWDSPDEQIELAGLLGIIKN